MKTSRTLSTPEMLARAATILAAPPALARIQRPSPVGELVARFALPNAWLKPQNWARHRSIGVLAKLKNQIADRMAVQHRRREAPLPGRPFVRCVRFSTTEPDKYADCAKMAIDVLCMQEPGKHRRLNFLRDDKPECVDVHQWWEPAKRVDSFTYIEVYTGRAESGR